MPLRNRVLPTQEIVAIPARGLLMGNRGCLHGQGRDLGGSRWRSKLWICCVLDWKGVRRDVMPPGRWTALFFLDEATAFAAGHRPCAYCRRTDYRAFTAAWQASHDLAAAPKAYEMDAVLHGQRVESYTRRQRTRAADPAGLPDGAMVRAGGRIGVLVGGGFRPWAPTGYGPAEPAPAAPVDVLTPPATTAVLAAGYRPLLHPSAGAGRPLPLTAAGAELP